MMHVAYLILHQLCWATFTFIWCIQLLTGNHMGNSSACKCLQMFAKKGKFVDFQMFDKCGIYWHGKALQVFNSQPYVHANVYRCCTKWRFHQHWLSTMFMKLALYLRWNIAKGKTIPTHISLLSGFPFPEWISAACLCQNSILQCPKIWF